MILPKDQAGNAQQNIGEVYGLVTTVSGSPASRVRVVLLPLTAPTSNRYTSTDLFGRFRFRSVPDGFYSLLVVGSSQQDVELEVRGRVLLRRRTIGSAYLVAPRGINITLKSGTKPPPSPSPTPAPSPRVSPSPAILPSPTPRIKPSPAPSVRPSASPNLSPSPRTNPSPVPSAQPNVSPNQSPTPTSAIDQRLQAMDLGNIAFNVPPNMTLDKSEFIVLKLSLSQSPDNLKQILEGEHVAGDIKTDRIKVDDNMQAILTGDGFQITPVTAESLPISKQSTTEWKWDVRPLRSGVLRLHVVLNALVDVDGTGKRPYPIKSFDHEYRVDVPWQNKPVFAFVGNNWQWLWTTLIIPVGAWVWNRRRKKKGKAGFI